MVEFLFTEDNISVVSEEQYSEYFLNCNKKVWGTEWLRADIWGQGLSAGKTSTLCLVCDSLPCRN